MKSVEEAQAAIDAIREVCKQHRVVLVGVCHSEGIFGEIEVLDAADLGARDFSRMTNRAELMGNGTIITDGIGEEAAMDETAYCCEKFKESASGDDPEMQLQSDGRAWSIAANEIVALCGVIYCPFCGKRLPVVTG